MKCIFCEEDFLDGEYYETVRTTMHGSKAVMTGPAHVVCPPEEYFDDYEPASIEEDSPELQIVGGYRLREVGDLTTRR